MFIKAGDRTPEVKIDSQAGQVIFSGESYPENAINFYKPIIETLESLCQSGTSLSLRFELIYINSSSLGMLRNMMIAIERYAQQGLSATVSWQAYEDDDGMREMGEDLRELYPSIEFKLHIVKE